MRRRLVALGWTEVREGVFQVGRGEADLDEDEEE